MKSEKKKKTETGWNFTTAKRKILSTMDSISRKKYCSGMKAK